MENIRKKTKFGMIWNVLEKFSVQGVSFFIGIILARILTPNDYGLIGLLSVFLAYANILVDSGFSRALIQKIDRTETDFSTMFFFNVVISVLIYLILFFCAPFIAKFYNKPELVKLQYFLFLIIPLNSLSFVPNTKLQISIDFKKIAIVNFITVFLSGSLGIFFAIKGYGVWALIIQNLSNSILKLFLLLFFCKWIPKTGFSFDSFKHMFGYGSKLIITGIISTTVNNVVPIVTGKFYSTEALGYYNKAYNFPELTSGTLTSVLSTSTFPLLASLQNKREELVEVCKKLITLTAMVSFPAMAGISVLSNNIILVLLSEKWAPVVPLLTFLSLAYILRPLNTINLSILSAIGRTDLFLIVDLISFPISIAALAFSLPISLKAVVISKIITEIIYFYILVHFFIGKLFPLGVFQQLKCMWKTIVSTIIMVLVIFPINTLWKTNEILKLFIIISIGVIVYYVSLKLFHENEVEIFEKKVKSVFQKGV